AGRQGSVSTIEDARFIASNLSTSSSEEFAINRAKNKLAENSQDDQSTYQNPITPELDDCAMIREVHVYGPSLRLKTDSFGEAQHLGLGTKLIEKAKQITKDSGFSKLAVISAIGTR